MRSGERLNYIKRAPKLAWNILIRGHHHFQYDLMAVELSHIPLRKRINMLRTAANLVHRRTHPWGWPQHIHLELTNYCNLKCPVCPTGLGTLNRKPQAIDPLLLKRLIKEIGPYLLTASLWGWGEPLLHPQLPDVLRTVHNRGFTTFLSTNGQNLDNEDVLQALTDYPPTYLIVCLDGITDATNSVFRVGARLAPALEGVQRLVQMKAEKGSAFPVLHLRYIVMSHNEHELPRLETFARENKFEQMTIRTLSVIDAPDDSHNELIPKDERFRAYDYKNNKRIRREDFMCEKAFTFPIFFADGTVGSCDQDYNGAQAYGSIAAGSTFADIWWSQQAKKVRKTIRDNPEAFSSCKNCPFRDRPVSTCSIQYFNLQQ